MENEDNPTPPPNPAEGLGLLARAVRELTELGQVRSYRTTVSGTHAKEMENVALNGAQEFFRDTAVILEAMGGWTAYRDERSTDDAPRYTASMTVLAVGPMCIYQDGRPHHHRSEGIQSDGTELYKAVEEFRRVRAAQQAAAQMDKEYNA